MWVQCGASGWHVPYRMTKKSAIGCFFFLLHCQGAQSLIALHRSAVSVPPFHPPSSHLLFLLEDRFDLLHVVIRHLLHEGGGARVGAREEVEH